MQAVRLLVDKGGAATINAGDQHGYSPLHVAVGEAQQPAALVSLLISSGADVNAETNDKVTPLMLARELPVVRQLLGAGATVNAKSADGTTALHKAAELGLSAAAVCCLLKAGADATTTDSEGYDAAAVAVKHGHTATAALLQRAASDQLSTASIAAPVTAAAAAAAAAAPDSDGTSTATSTASGRSTTGFTAAAAAASAATHAKHSVGAVKGNTVKPRAAPMTAAAAARAAAAATKATATWMCMACKHIGNPIQEAACRGCGVIGNTEQQRREFEASLPEHIARGPDIELPSDYSSRWSAKATTKSTNTSTAKATTRNNA
jgi:Ankyrin repeats (3 copies)/Ankyrin repeat